MSGLIALLDDVAGIAKVAAASIDDVAGQAAKAGGAKAAGAVIDDAAVTPKYLTGFRADRELPIVGKIAWGGSIKNKLIILLPIAMLLSTFAPPWAIAPLLMLGGGGTCVSKGGPRRSGTRFFRMSTPGITRTTPPRATRPTWRKPKWRARSRPISFCPPRS